MANKFGPWTTMIDPGGNPQLSAFWRRRLQMLVPASKTSPVLSRRNMLFLIAVGILICILPTFFLAPAVAEQEISADKALTDNNSHNQSASESATPAWMKEDSLRAIGGVHGYEQLQFEFVRKGLKITSEQEQKLRAIAIGYQAFANKYDQESKKEAENLVFGKPATKKMEILEAFLQQEHKNIRKQINELLTGEQKTLLTSFVVRSFAASVFLQYNQNLGLTEEQKKELERLSGEEKIKRWQLSRKMTERILNILSPRQREKLESKSASKIETDTLFGPLFGPYYEDQPFSMYGALTREDIQLGLSLHPQTMNKLHAIIIKYSAMTLKESSKPKQEFQVKTESGLPDLSTLDDQSLKPESELREIGKQMRTEIDSLLTPQQLATLKKIALKELALQLLGNLQIINEIGVTDEQQKEFIRIRAETIAASSQLTYDTGDKALKILTPQQREKFEQQVVGMHNYLVANASNNISNTLAEEKKPADEKSRMDKTLPVYGSFEASQPGDVISIPVYQPLADKNTRKELNITAEQENKLREISANYRTEMEILNKDIEKKFMPEFREAERRKVFKQKRIATKKQIEEMLNADQLNKLRTIALYKSAIPVLSNPYDRKNLALSEEQIRQLNQIREDMTIKNRQIYQPCAKKLLAVFRPEQYEIIKDRYGKRLESTRVSYPSPNDVSLIIYPELQEEAVRKELVLSVDQHSKLQTIYSKLQTASQELSKLHKKETLPEYRNKLDEFGKNIRIEIEQLLTSQQLAALKKIMFYPVALSALSGGYLSDPEFLEQINASDEQQKRLRDIRNELLEIVSPLMQSLSRETGRKLLEILTPRQKEILIEMLDPKNETQDPEESKSTFTDSANYTMTKVVGNTLTISKTAPDQSANSVDKGKLYSAQAADEKSDKKAAPRHA